MEDEIDLRKYILLLVRHWKWIAGVPILFVLSVFLISKFVLPPTYETEAILFIVQPQYSITFDPKFSTQNKTDLIFYTPVDQLAVANDVVQEVHDAWMQAGHAPLTIKQIKRMMDVEDITSNSLKLSITSAQPELAADLVNLWADILIKRANAIYSNQDTDTDTLLDQLNQTKAQREAAQQALVEFQEQNDLLVLQAQISVTQTTYYQFLVDQANILQGLQDIQALQSQLSSQPQDQVISFDNELTALLLQLKIYNLDKSILLNLDGQNLASTKTVREVRVQLEQLSEVLTRQTEQIALELEPLQTNLLALQGKITALQTTETELNQDYRLAADTYLILARKLEENKVASQINTSSIRPASYAIPPTSPSGPNTLLNTLIAGVLGVFLSVGVVVARSIWEDISPQPEPAAPSAT